jgi:hypothetical protein
VTGSNVVIKGNSSGRTGLRIGNPDLWQFPNWQTYPQTYSLIVQGCSNVLLENLSVSGSRTWEASIIYGSASNVWIRNAAFSLHGNNNNSITASPDAGDLLVCCGKRVLIEDTDFSFGGHNVLYANGPYQVYRRCTFDGSWVGKGTGFPGARCAVFEGGASKDRKEPAANPGEFGPVLIEDCVFKNSADSVDQAAQVAAKLQGFRIITRSTYFWDIDAQLWLGPGFGNVLTFTGETMSRPYAYHNTSYNTAGVWINADSVGDYADDMQLGRFVNNVFAETRDGAQRNSATYGRYVVEWDTNANGLNGHPNNWKGTVWASNVFQGTAGTRMGFNLLGGSTWSIVNDAASPWPSNVYGNVTAPSIAFSDPTARNKAGFAIGSGTGYQDAAALTTTLGSGAAANVVTVADAGYFYDGWGITGESGDYVKIGSNTPVKVTAVNWTNNTLTLANPISWANGDSVFYAGNDGADNGGTVFDNRGAWQ